MEGRQFTGECKRGAVNLARQPDASKAGLARDLSINANMLRRCPREQEGRSQQAVRHKTGFLSSDKFECMCHKLAKVKTGRLSRNQYPTRNELRAELLDYMGRLYNPERRDQTIGYVIPIQFEDYSGLSERIRETGEGQHLSGRRAASSCFSKAFLRLASGYKPGASRLPFPSKRYSGAILKARRAPAEMHVTVWVGLYILSFVSA